LELLEYGVQSLIDDADSEDEGTNRGKEQGGSNDSIITLISVSEHWSNFPLVSRCEPASVSERRSWERFALRIAVIKL